MGKYASIDYELLKKQRAEGWTMLEEDKIMPYSVVIGNVHDNKDLCGGNEK